MFSFVTVVVFLSWFAGSFVSGVTSIGGGMVALPILGFVLPMNEVIPLCCLLNLVMDGSIAALYFRHCRMSAVVPMLAGAIPGSAVGVYILNVVPGPVLAGIVGVLLLLYVVWQLRKKEGEGRPDSPKLAALAGVVSGVVGSAISFDGPPVAAYSLSRGWTPQEVLGTLGVYFVIRSTFSCAMQWYTGLYTTEILMYTLYGAGGCVLGVLVAAPVVKRICVATFSKWLLAVIAAGGVACLWQAFQG